MSPLKFSGSGIELTLQVSFSKHNSGVRFDDGKFAIIKSEPLFCNSAFLTVCGCKSDMTISRLGVF